MAMGDKNGNINKRERFNHQVKKILVGGSSFDIPSSSSRCNVRDLSLVIMSGLDC